MSEAVDILIQAEDKASTKLKAVGNATEDLGKRVKDAGGKVKASAELAGTFANVLGGTSFGGFAGELGQLTERISAFSEVSKAGGAGALIFKAGLAAAVAITSFKVGEAIGNWAFETDNWRKAMEAAQAQAEKLNGLQQASQQKQFANVREDIGLIGDPAEREAAMKAREQQLLTEQAGAEAAVKSAQKLVAESEKRRDRWSLGSTLRRGEYQGEVKNNEDLLKNERQRLDGIKNELQAFRELNGERTKSNEALKAQNEAKAKSSGFLDGLQKEVELLRLIDAEREAISQRKLSDQDAGNAERSVTAERNTTPEQRGKAEELLRERDALKAKAEAQKAADAAAEQAKRKEEADAERIKDLQERELQRLEAKRIELEQGKAAAKAYMLEQEGLSKAAASAIASQEADLEKLAAQKKGEASTEPLQAVQSRLLTRGSGGIDPNKQVADNTAKIAQGQSAQLKAMQDMIAEQRRTIAEMKAGSIKLVMVGVP